MTVTIGFFLAVLAFLPPGNAVVTSKNYAMYVWSQSFNVDAAHCGGVYPANRNDANATCFDHSWDTPEARSRLMSSVSVPGRDVSRIFVSDVSSRTQYNGYKDTANNCDNDLMTMLAEAHASGLEVYGLFADSDSNFSEKDKVGRLKEFNTNCGNADVYFDGAAVNNEHFTSIKSCDVGNEDAQLEFLDNLNTTKHNAELPLHFSVSWNWDCCSCSSSSYTPRMLTYGGSTKTALEHMIDIADSVDVQVAWNKGSTMAKRSWRAYTHWLANKSGTTSTTAFYVLAYTNPNSDCRLSFAPHAKGSASNTDTCSTGNRTQAGMYEAFDVVESNQTDARGGIHYMGGVFSTGMVGWPKHTSTSTPAPISPPPTSGPTPVPTPVPTTTSTCTIVYCGNGEPCCDGDCQTSGKETKRACNNPLGTTGGMGGGNMMKRRNRHRHHRQLRS